MKSYDPLFSRSAYTATDPIRTTRSASPPKLGDQIDIRATQGKGPARISHTASTEVARLSTHSISASADTSTRVPQEQRAALKAAHKELSSLVSGLVSGKVAQIEKGSAQVTKALEPLTKGNDSSQVLERLCGACLREELPKLSIEQLKSMYSHVTLLSMDQKNRVFVQIQLSVTAEFLRRMPEEDRKPGAPGKSALGDMQAPKLALLILKRAAHLDKSTGNIVGTHFTRQQLEDISTTPTVTRVIETPRPAPRGLAKDVPTMPVAALRKLNDDLTLSMPTKGGKPDPAYAHLHKVVKARIAAIDRGIAAQTIGLSRDFNLKAMSEKELVAAWKAIAAQPPGQTVLAEMAIEIREETALRHDRAIPKFQEALRMAITESTAIDAVDLLLRSAAALNGAALVAGWMGQRLDYEQISQWIDAVLVSEMKRGDSGLDGLKALQTSLSTGDGKVIQETLARPTERPISTVIVAQQFLSRLSEALDEKLPATAAPSQGGANAVATRPLKLGEINGLRINLHIEAGPLADDSLVDIESDIQAAKADVASALIEGLQGADTMRVMTLVDHMLLMTFVTEDATQYTRMNGLAMQLKSHPSLNAEAADALQSLTDLLARF